MAPADSPPDRPNRLSAHQSTRRAGDHQPRHALVLPPEERGRRIRWRATTIGLYYPTAVLVTVTRQPPGYAVDLRLAPLTPSDLTTLVPGLPPDAIHALWLASAGWPGTALKLAARVSDPEKNDTLVELALTTASRAQFLDRDVALVRLLEEAVARPLPSTVRARVLARLARELVGDQSTIGRRRALIDEAIALARAAGEPGVTAEVLDCRLYALWDPAAAAERFTVASQIVGCARAAGDAATERRGTFWRFIALAEQGDLDAAEAALAAYGKAVELDGDPEAGVVVLARQAALAIVRGRFALAETLTCEVAEQGRQIGRVDTGRLTASLTGWLALLRGAGADHIPPLMEMARRFPGQFYEATAARVMAETGQVTEALLELDRLLPAVLAGDGPRWLGAAADLALVASLGAAGPSTQALYEALEPYAGRLVVWGGANMIVGPVDEYLGRLAACQGLDQIATGHFDRAAETAERLGALPWLASILAARGRPGDADRSRDITRRLGLGSPAAKEWILRRTPRTGSSRLMPRSCESATVPACGTCARCWRLRDARSPRWIWPPAVPDCTAGHGSRTRRHGPRRFP